MFRGKTSNKSYFHVMEKITSNSPSLNFFCNFPSKTFDSGGKQKSANEITHSKSGKKLVF